MLTKRPAKWVKNLLKRDNVFKLGVAMNLRIAHFRIGYLDQVLVGNSEGIQAEVQNT